MVGREAIPGLIKGQGRARGEQQKAGDNGGRRGRAGEGGGGPRGRVEGLGFRVRRGPDAMILLVCC